MNDNGTYTVGSAANSATQLVQNRMHATTDNTGGGARLYSENRMLNQTVTADRSYPIAIVHGYRGLNVSNYVPGDGTTMGMSKYTMLVSSATLPAGTSGTAIHGPVRPTAS